MRRLLILVSLLALMAGCRFRPDDRPSWDTDLTAPLLKSRVSLEDAIRDTNLVHVNSDNSLTVVFRDTLVDLQLSDYLTVPDTSFSAKISLQTISLATDTLTQDITLGQIARQLRDGGNALGQTLLNSHGQTLFFIPPINNVSSDDVAVDASQFFDEADLLTGWMVVEIENHLRLTIDNVTFHLRNNGLLTDTLVRKSMGQIAPNQSAVDSADLSGKTVESSLAAKLEDIDVLGGTNVYVDTNDYIRIRIIVKDLTASRATAVFPSQNVIDDQSRINYYVGNGLNITRIRARSGQLRLQALSTIQDTIAFIYKLPTAIKNGQPVVVQDRLVPDTINGFSTADIMFDLNDYYIDLTVNGDSVNLFPYHLIGNLLYSGRKNTMDLSDSIDVTYGLYDIIPAYIEGYLGEATFSFTDSIDMSFFSSVLGGYLNLANPKVDLTLVNSIGVDGELQVHRMDAINTRTGNTVSLSGGITSSPTEVRGPKLPNVGQSVISKVNLNRNNSNISAFISNLPDRVEFDMEVFVNKYGNPALLDNFATDESRLAAYLDIEVPLEGIAENLLLEERMDLNLSDATIPKGVKEGTFKLIMENTFPMQAKVQIYFENSPGVVVDSLFQYGGEIIAPGLVNASGFVDQPGKSVLSAFFTAERFERLREDAHHALVKFSLSTRPSMNTVKLYTTYGIDFQMVGDFKYALEL